MPSQLDFQSKYVTDTNKDPSKSHASQHIGYPNQQHQRTELVDTFEIHKPHVAWWPWSLTFSFEIFNVSSAFIGCVFLNASGAKMLSWCTSCSPSYLGPFTYVTDFPSRRGLHSSCSDCLFSLQFTAPLLAAQHFWLLALRCGTACHRRLRQHCLWRPSALDSRRFCWLPHIMTFGWSDILCLHTVYSGPSIVLNTLVTLKIHDWLIDWLIDWTFDISIRLPGLAFVVVVTRLHKSQTRPPAVELLLQ